MSKKIGTARSLIKTTESALYQTFDLDSLRIAARDGDIATVSRVLDVRPGLCDAQTLYNAAKCGHDAVINLLFALGNFEPDPEPLDNLPSEYSTPILAAIGKDYHVEVIKLFLGNSRFNPARPIQGETYFDIAAQRAGSNWQEEVTILKEAYEEYQNLKTLTGDMAWSLSSRHSKRPLDLDFRKNRSRGSHYKSRKQKQIASSVSKDWLPNKTRHHNFSATSQYKDWSNSCRNVTDRLNKDNESNVAHSEPEDRFVSPSEPNTLSQKYISEPSVTPEVKLVKRPRRKLFSRKALKNERRKEKRRRASISSSTYVASGNLNEERSGRIQLGTKYIESEEKCSVTSEQLYQKPLPLFKNNNKVHYNKCEDLGSEKDQSEKENGLKNHVSIKHGGSSVKRSCSSQTPPLTQSVHLPANTHDQERSLKKSKKNRHNKPNSSNVDIGGVVTAQLNTPISNVSYKSVGKKHSINQGSQRRKPPIFKSQKSPSTLKYINNRVILPIGRLSTGSNSIPLGASFIKNTNGIDRNVGPQDIAERINYSSIKAGNIEDESSNHIHIKIEKSSLNTVRQNDSVDYKDFQIIEDTTKSKSILGKEFSGESEGTRGEEEFKGKQWTQDLDVQKQTQDEQRQRFQEIKCLKCEEQDHRKFEISEEQQRLECIKIEGAQREKRLSKLPLLLKWFDQTPEPKTAEIAKLFSYIVGYRYDTINTKAIGQRGGGEQWMLNTHAAILLGEKDLQLSRYTSWERVFLTIPQKRGVWNSCNGLFLLLDGDLSLLRNKLPYNPQPMDEVIEENRKQFLELNLFFIKVVEFMYVVPNFPHLQGIEMVVLYRELNIPQCVTSSYSPQTKMRWHRDTQFDSLHNLVPLPTYYTNGALINHNKDSNTRVLKKPPAPDIYPRRMGLTRVYPWESDYQEICKNQNLFSIKTSTLSLKKPQISQNISLIPDP